jgi:hypothetical protein
LIDGGRQELEALVQQQAAGSSSSSKGRLVTADISAGLEKVRHGMYIILFT